MIRFRMMVNITLASRLVASGNRHENPLPSMAMSPGRRPIGSRPANTSTIPAITISTPSAINARPMSPASNIVAPSGVMRHLNKAFLLRARRIRHAQVLVSAAGCNAAPVRALQEAQLQQVRLVHVHDGVSLFADGRRQRLEADRSAVVLVDDRV